MNDFVFVCALALIYAVVMLAAPYLVLVLAANLLYRLAAGKFFRWLSWRTVVPFFVLLLGGWGFIAYALSDPRAFAITH